MSCLLELLGKALDTTLLGLFFPRQDQQKPDPQEPDLQEPDPQIISTGLDKSAIQKNKKLRLGLQFAQEGCMEKAQAVFRDILQHQPGQIESSVALAAILSANGELDAAIEILQQARGQHEKDVRILYSLGHCYERQGKVDQAFDFYQQSTLWRPFLREPYQRLAALHLSQFDYENSIRQYQILQREFPEDIWIYLVLGQMYLHIKDYPNAVLQFEKALTIEPDNFELHDDEVESLAKSGQFEDAIQRMHQLIETQGDFSDSYVRLADLYCQINNDDAAVSSYHKALALHPGYLEAAVKLGAQHLRMGRFFDAAKKFNQAVEINDQLIVGYVGLGIAQQKNRQLEEAKDTLELALALEPNSNLLLTEMVRLQLKLALARKHGEQAFPPYSSENTSQSELDDLLALQIERHRQALLNNGGQADLHYRYAMLLRGKGKIENAIHHLRQAVQINPSFHKATLKLGLALLEETQTVEALELLAKSLDIEDEYIRVHYKLGLMFCDKIQFALAVEHFQNHIPENTDNPNIHANLTLALQNMGLIDRAAAAWRSVCELDPASPMAFQAQRSIVSLKTIR
jgi:tetratricopeptide (TPR) repeat protein